MRKTDVLRRLLSARGLAPCLAVALIAGAAGPALAQSSRDAEFAEQLMRRGYDDLAEAEARRIEADTSYPSRVRGDAGYLLVRILKAQATVRGSSELLAEVSELIEELQQRYPDHPQSAVADLEQLQTRLTQAETLRNQARDEGDPEAAQELRDRSAALYQESLAEFDTVIAQIEERLQNDPRNEDLAFRRDLGEYLRADAYLNYGTALDAGHERDQALERAHELFARFFGERPSFFNLWTMSYIGRGKAEVELGRYREAIRTFQDAEYIQPPGSRDPELMRQQQEFVDDVRSEAFLWLIRAAVRSGEPQRGVDAFRNFRRAFPDSARTHFGRMAALEYAKALAALGRMSETADAIDEVLRESMQSDSTIAGLDIDRYGVAACRALAAIIKENPGFFFPAPLQYRAGQGFFFDRDYEGATYALKGVLASATTEAEREEWGARALLDLAAAYAEMGRHFEAGLAYQGVYRMFPEHEQAARAISRARQAFRKLAEADPWFQALADEVTRDEQEVLTGIGAERSKYNQANEWQRQGRFTDAARLFLSVQRTIGDGDEERPVPFYGQALAAAGFCYFRAADEATGGAASSYRRQAEETLDEALRYGRDNEDLDAWSAAAYYLALIASSEEVGAYELALDYLSDFDGPLAEQRGQLARAYALQARCYVQLDRLEEAEERVQRLARAFPNARELPGAAVRLGMAFEGRSDAAFERYEHDAGLAYARKAARYVGMWVEAAERVTFSGASWAGDVLYRGEDYARAAAAYERALSETQRSDLSAREQEQLHYEYTQLQHALTLSRLGQQERAVEIFEQLRTAFEEAGEDPFDDFLFAYGYSDALYALWMETGSDQTLVRLQEAHQQYRRLVRRVDEGRWDAIVQQYRLPRTPYIFVEKENDARLLEIQLGFKEWGRVRFQVDQLVRAGELDDIVYLHDNIYYVGVITAEDDSGVTVKLEDGSEQRVEREAIDYIDRFPAELRERFLDIRRRAIEEGNL